MSNSLQDHLQTKLKQGRKLFVPYVTAGLPSPQAFVDLFSDLSWCADAIEIGIPYSDPVMDGPIIQQSSMKALKSGVTVHGCLQLIRQCLQHSSCPAVVMSYFNPIHRMGLGDFVKELSFAGVGGLIVPDLPFEESGDLSRKLAKKKIAHIQMVAPTTSPERAAKLAKASTGWVYAVSRMGVTGEQQSLASVAGEVVDRVKAHARAPVLLGIGISNGEQAKDAAQYADGVIVGSAIVKKVLMGDLEGAVQLAQEIRLALDRLPG